MECGHTADLGMQAMDVLHMAQANNSLLGEDVDSWKTMMFIYNSALKEVAHTSGRENFLR